MVEEALQPVVFQPVLPQLVMLQPEMLQIGVLQPVMLLFGVLLCVVQQLGMLLRGVLLGYTNTPNHGTHHWRRVALSTMLQQVVLNEWTDILTKMFTYELIMFILIINYETFSHILVKNESIIALLEGKLLNMSESISYMQFKMTRPDTAWIANRNEKRKLK